MPFSPRPGFDPPHRPRRREKATRRALTVARPDPTGGFGPRDRLYFLHIHKTAGSTLTRILETHFGQGEICPPQTWQRLQELDPATLADYRLFRGHFLHFAHLLPEPPWVVTFLRDPVERTLSTYAYVRRNDRHRFHHLALDMDLDEFLAHPDTAETVRDLQTRWIAANAIPCSSLRDMEAEADRLDLDVLTIARHQLDACAQVGLVERFDESVSRLMATMGWHLFDWMTEHADERVNVSEDRIRRDDLGTATLARIDELTALDQALYQSVADRFDEPPAGALPEATGPFADEPTQRLQLDFSGPVPGFGWQMPETHPVTGAGFRWIGPSPEATLFLPLATGADLDVVLTVQKAITPEVLASLTLRVNDVPVPITLVGDDEPLRVTGRVPATAVDPTRPQACLRFAVAETTSPAALGRAPDRRRLGVAFSELRVTPTT